jgi:hypothetical protein
LPSLTATMVTAAAMVAAAVPRNRRRF